MTGPARTQTLAARVFAWAGAALFAASLAYFLFSYTVTFVETGPAASAPRNAAFNVALFSLFALHHSLFARTPLRAWVSRVASPHLERSTYVWIASLMLVLVCAFWRPLPGIAWEVTGAGVWVLRAALAAGIWLTLRSAAMIDIWDLAGVRTRSPEGRGTAFRADGPYGWVRHPIYSGWFLIVFSATPMTMTRLVFAVVSCAYVLVAIPLEERSLRTTAGGAYERYARQVKWKLLPGVY